MPRKNRCKHLASEAEVEVVLAEFAGDARAAMRALLHDIAVLAEDFEASVSRGYVRGEIPARARPTPAFALRRADDAEALPVARHAKVYVNDEKQSKVD